MMGKGSMDMVQIMIMRIDTEMLWCGMRSIYCTIYQYVSLCITCGYNINESVIIILRHASMCYDSHVTNLSSFILYCNVPWCVGFCALYVRPNAFKYIQSDGAGVKLYVRALEDLKVGEKVSISYIPDAQTGTLKGWSRTRSSKMFELVAGVPPQKSHQDAFSCRSMLKLWYVTCLNSSWREIPMQEWRETCKESAPI